MDAEHFMGEVLARVPAVANLGQDPNPELPLVLEGMYFPTERDGMAALFFPIAAQADGFMQGYLRVCEDAQRAGWACEAGEVHLTQFGPGTHLVSVSGMDFRMVVEMARRSDAEVSAICREHFEEMIA